MERGEWGRGWGKSKLTSAHVVNPKRKTQKLGLVPNATMDIHVL